MSHEYSVEVHLHWHHEYFIVVTLNLMSQVKLTSQWHMDSSIHCRCQFRGQLVGMTMYGRNVQGASL